MSAAIWHKHICRVMSCENTRATVALFLVQISTKLPGGCSKGELTKLGQQQVCMYVWMSAGLLLVVMLGMLQTMFHLDELSIR